MELTEDIKTILKSATITGNFLRLNGQLDRKAYLTINEVLETAGGKWSRKDKAHVFTNDPKRIIDNLINPGSVITETAKEKKKEFQFFETPTDLAEKMVDVANIKSTDICLEPSAGNGRIADILKTKSQHTSCVEIQEECRKQLTKNGHSVVYDDFLNLADNIQFDKIVMNPPFTKGQDIQHLRHAYDFLKTGGRIVCLTSASWTYNTQKKFVAFKEWFENAGGTYEEIPAGTFKESGTEVKTLLCVLDK